MNKFIVNYKNLKVFKEEEEILKKSFKSFLKSGIYLIGSKTNDCEKKIAKKVGRKYCVLVSSGTNAIYLSLKSLGIKKGMRLFAHQYRGLQQQLPYHF